MIQSLQALITRHGNVVRSGIARPSTVARYLAHVPNLAEYQVAYWYHGHTHRVTGESFLALYETGRLATLAREKGEPDGW